MHSTFIIQRLQTFSKNIVINAFINVYYYFLNVYYIYAQRRLRRVVGPVEETCFQSSTELFATNGVGSEVNGKSVPNRRSRDTEATRSIAFSSASRNDEVKVAR